MRLSWFSIIKWTKVLSFSLLYFVQSELETHAKYLHDVWAINYRPSFILFFLRRQTVCQSASNNINTLLPLLCSALVHSSAILCLQVLAIFGKLRDRLCLPGGRTGGKQWAEQNCMHLKGSVYSRCPAVLFLPLVHTHTSTIYPGDWWGSLVDRSSERAIMHCFSLNLIHLLYVCFVYTPSCSKKWKPIR